MERSNPILSLIPFLLLILIPLLIYFLYARKRSIVYFEHPESGKMESLIVGFNFILLFFGFIFFGLLLYLRGLIKWGVFFTILNIVPLVIFSRPNDLFSDKTQSIIIISFGLIVAVCQIYLGIKGNELTAKKLIKKGYHFVQPESEKVILAKKRWNI